MCGIAGELRSHPLAQQEHLHAMGRAIAHRGPDAADVWTDTAAGIGLVHRRLAIVDLTPAGHDLFRAVSSGLDTISAGVGLLQPDGLPETVTVSATDGMATWWLKPRAAFTM